MFNISRNTKNSSSNTNFEKVIEFNETFKVKTHYEPQTQIFNTNPNLTKLRLDLILEETQELKDAIENKDFPEIVDALTDILYVVYGAGSSFGVNLDKAFELVHKSNMSKLCDDEKTAELTVQKYKLDYLNNKSPYDSPNYKYDENTQKYIVYNENTGKILKSINYKPVNFSMLK